MIDAANLERGYRRWLRWYPKEFRDDHEEEILAVLLAGARSDQRQPEPIECLDLLRGALWMRLRPSVPRSDRWAFTAVRLMYAGAVVELATAITVLATIADVRASVLRGDPRLTDGEWHAAVAGHIAPTAMAAAIAVGFWLWMAWSIGRGHRWPRIAFAIFFGLNTMSLVNGLAGGSAVYARQDLVAGTVLWLVELAAVILLFRMKVPASRSSARRTPGRW
jgi:hypothetical protein